MSATRITDSGAEPYDAKQLPGLNEMVRKTICEKYHVKNFSEMTKDQIEQELAEMGVPLIPPGPDMNAGIRFM